MCSNKYISIDNILDVQIVAPMKLFFNTSVMNFFNKMNIKHTIYF